MNDDVEQLRAEIRRLEAERDALRERFDDQVLHPQRIEATGTLAAGLAHDMNNVLAAITSFAELVLDDCGNQRWRRDLEQIIQQAERGASLTRGLLAFSRKGQYRRRVLEIDRVLRDIEPLLAHTLPKTIEVSIEPGASEHRVDADPAQLAQVLVNLGINAADAMNGSGRLAIASSVVDGRAWIRVSDTGCGMDEATRQRAFEPFFTTKGLGKGTGLGLALVWGVVQAHGGTVDIESSPGHGTTVSIQLPLTDAPVVVAAPRQPRTPGKRRGTILVVDDELRVREGTTRILERVGYAVVGAEDGAHGLRAYDTHREAIGLVILDMAMPVMSGVECFRRLRALTDVPVLIATGFAHDHDVQAMLAADARVIEKPYSSTDLLVEVARLIDRRPGVSSLAGGSA